MGRVKDHLINMTNAAFEALGYDYQQDDEIWIELQDFIMENFELSATTRVITDAWKRQKKEHLNEM